MTNAIVCTGETYEEIAKMVDDQPRNDWEPLGDMMHDYRGMLAGWPAVLQIHAVRVHKSTYLKPISHNESYLFWKASSSWKTNYSYWMK